LKRLPLKNGTLFIDIFSFADIINMKLKFSFMFIFFAYWSIFHYSTPFAEEGDSSLETYKTKQRQLILNYLIQNKNTHITADDVSDHLRRQGTSVGKATIYRYLDRLVAQNVVRRFSLGNRASACYQYIGDDQDCQAHYHLMCTGCGKLIHMECSDLDRIFCHLDEEHSFKADPSKTIVYGECRECSRKETSKV